MSPKTAQCSAAVCLILLFPGAANAALVVAAKDSLKKEQADFVCDGIDDQVQVQEAIDSLPSTGGVVELLAYELPTPAVAPGGMVTLLTLWRILDPEALGPVPPQRFGRAAAIFVHLLDAAGNVVGQEDRLDAPAWNWHAGDAFVQLHRFQIDPGVPSGLYRLEVGIYTHEDLTRLPVLVNGIVVDDRILLSPVEVASQ